MIEQRWPQWAIVVVAIAGIGVVAVQSIAKQGVTFEVDRGEVASVTRGDLMAYVTLDDGAHKPHVTYKGNSILEFSDWASDINSRGNRRSLWESRFGVDVSEDLDEIIYTRSVADYELSQITKLEDTHVTVSYFIAPAARDEIGPVELTLAHYRWYFSAVDIVKNGATLRYETTPDTVWFRHSADVPLVVRSDGIGPHSFLTEYTLESVPTGERTLLAQEEIWFVEPPDE